MDASRGDPAARAHGAPRPRAPDRRRLPGRHRADARVVDRPLDRLRRAVRIRRARLCVSPGHFAERFSLIVIIALGESIVAIGTGLEGELDAGTIGAALLGLVLACGLWWAYFDVVAIVAERRFRELGRARGCIARDSYSYLHLPMIAGIVLVALGVKKALGDVDEPLKTIPSWRCSAASPSTTPGHVGLPAAQRRHGQPPPPAGAPRLRTPDTGGARGRCHRGARAGRRSSARGDRIRGDPLRGGAPPSPARGA